jgi:predicted permease
MDTNRSIPSDQLMVARLYLPDGRYKDTDARQRFYDQLLPRLQVIPGVTRATIVSNPPGLGSADTHIEIEHGPVVDAAHRPPVSFVVSSPGYLQTIRLPLLTGRDFNALDGTAGHYSAIVTRETAQRFWPGQSALGHRFRLYDEPNKPGDWITVIGVSANIVQDVDSQNPNPLFFQPFRQMGWAGMSLVVESKSVESSSNPTKAVSAAVQSLDGDLPLRDTWILSGEIEHNQWYLHLFSKVFMGFALIALLMAAVGIYAVLAQATSRRTQEIGVRIALGASMRNIMVLVMRRGLWQIVAGLTLGLAAAFPAARLMGSLPIGVSPTDPVVFVAVAAVLAFVGVVACWLPARRAAGLDPVKAIRYE